jgi:twinkle protein
MAKLLNADDIDFAAYMRMTDCKAKVRKASDFTDDLVQAFEDKQKGKRSPSMFSSRLGKVLEFRPGEVTVWAGYSKHRKSTFLGQVEAELMHQGQRCLNCSYEMLPHQTLQRKARQVLGTSHASRSTLEQFMRWTDNRLWIFDHMGRTTPDHQLAILRYFAEEIGGDQAFIDSFQFVCGSEESNDEQKQFMTDLVRMAIETGLHIHLVAHCRKPHNGDESRPPTKHDIRGTSAIGDQAANIVTVWYDRARLVKLDRHPSDEVELAKPAALVTVEGQRNGAWEGRIEYWQDESSMRFTDKRTALVEPWPLNLA